jgi:hypothetical protein
MSLLSCCFVGYGMAVGPGDVRVEVDLDPEEAEGVCNRSSLKAALVGIVAGEWVGAREVLVYFLYPQYQ